LLITILWW